MARLQETCGAVTGAYVVLGLELAKGEHEQEAIKEKTYAAIRQFERRFAGKHGTTSCRELLHCDLNTEEGKATYKKNALKENVCVPCVRDSVQLLQEILRR
jgi:C_GCAxxG_C_C family probable redox protein